MNVHSGGSLSIYSYPCTWAEFLQGGPPWRLLAVTLGLDEDSQWPRTGERPKKNHLNAPHLGAVENVYSF